MSFQDALNQRRRLSLLFALWLAPGYRLAVRAWRDSLAASYGIDAALHQVRADGAWLSETGLVTLDGEIAALTDMGMDVVQGRSHTPGVRRPDPGELSELRERG